MIIIALISFYIGFTLGVKTTLDYGIKVVMRLIEIDKLNIDIDKDMLQYGIMQYKNNIGGCLFLQNASVHNNSWD